MCKWSAKTDACSASLSFLALAFFLICVVASGRLYSTPSINVLETYTLVGSDLLFYFQFILSGFVVVITSFVFEETFRPSALGYLKTLPFTVIDAWAVRYLRLLIALLAMITPALIIAIAQTNAGMEVYYSVYSNMGADLRVSRVAVIINCFLTVNFDILVSQAALILCKHKILSNALLFSYGIMEMGPWGNFLGQRAIFYGCSGAYPIGIPVMPNAVGILCLSIGLCIIIFMWFRKNFTQLMCAE